jgi:hypothetical protein
MRMRLAAALLMGALTLVGCGSDSGPSLATVEHLVKQRMGATP